MEAASAQNIDPLDDLRAEWQTQIDFRVANPALFRLLSDPARVHRVAVAGRLGVSEPRAVALIQAAGIGVIQTLLSTPPEERDPGLAETIYESVLGQILTDAPAESGAMATAVASRAIAPGLDMLNDAKRRLLDDWLGRVISGL